MNKFLVMAVLSLFAAGSAYADRPMRFTADLEGFDLTGAPVPTNATGKAIVEVIDGGTAVEFKVSVAGIENLWMAHIHVAPEPVMVTDPAGPVAFWFTGGPPPGAALTEPVNGRLARGYIITDGQVALWDMSDPVAGTVAGLIAAIEQGRASVIVHTNDLDLTTPPGVAGDSPRGELRGSLN